MKICFDIRALQIGHEKRGIGMYAKSLLENLPSDTNIKYLFYAFDKSNPIKELGIDFKNDYELVQTPTIKTAVNSPSDILGLLRLINHRFAPLRVKSPDVFVQFDFTLGIPRWRKTKSVVIAYDLIPLIKKNEYLPSMAFAWHHSLGKKAKLRAVTRSIYYRLKYGLHYRVFKKADQLLSISEATSKSFVDLLAVPSQKISTIPLAPVFSAATPDKSITKNIKKPYIMYIGGTDSRKRIQDVVYAFNIAKGRGADIQLVLAGNEFKKAEDIPSLEGRNAILESSYRNDIILLGFVSDAEKMALYHSALAFVFCSSFEGFGLPVIEAMSQSCPVISYNNSSIPEAAGNAALLVDTGNYSAIANHILELGEGALREKLIKHGVAQSKKFNWPMYVEQFSKVINDL